MSKRKQSGNIAYICLILVLVLAIVYSGLRILESTVFASPGNQTEATHSKTITRDGVDYFPRQDITVMMVMGIDQFGPVQDSGSYNNTGVADMVALLIFDETNETCTVLCLNRDTMVKMNVLGLGGKVAGTRVAQLGLAHTYGSGLEDSCENTRNAVSALLNGITIDHYVSMNMDAISLLNDQVGGVTVTVTDDFSAIDPSITMGEMTLLGDQAIRFVRTRQGLGDQLNVSRMERQKEYIDGFLEALRERIAQDADFTLETYEKVSEYMVTDCSANVISSMLQRYSGYQVTDILSPQGEASIGDGYYQFHLDEELLDQLIVELFYAPK